MCCAKYLGYFMIIIIIRIAKIIAYAMNVLCIEDA